MPITGEITVSPKPFAAAVSWAAKWVTAKPVVPIHAGLSVEVLDGGLEIRAFDENAVARARIAADGLAGDAKGTAVVSGRLLADLAATFAGGKPVTLRGTAKGVELAAGRFTATLPGFADEDFPALPADLPPLGAVDGDAFADAVRRVVVAAGDDPTKGAMFVLLYVGFGADGALELMATDRYRVATTRVPWSINASGPEGFPASATPLAAVLGDAAAAFAGPDRIDLGFDGRSLSLTSPTRTLVMRLGDPGENGWPVEAMRKNLALADTYDGELTADRGDLAMPLKRAALVRGKAGPVKLGLAAGTLTIASSEAELGQDGNEEVDVGYAGPPASVAVNPAYLAEALASAPGDVIRLRLQAAEFTRRPVVLSCDADPHWRHVIVPVVQQQ